MRNPYTLALSAAALALASCSSDDNTEPTCFAACESATDRVACVAACEGEVADTSGGDAATGDADLNADAEAPDAEQDAVDVPDSADAGDLDAVDDAVDDAEVDKDTDVGADDVAVEDVVADVDGGGIGACEDSVPCLDSCEGPGFMDCAQECVTERGLTGTDATLFLEYAECAFYNCPPGPTDPTSETCMLDICRQPYRECQTDRVCADVCGYADGCVISCGGGGAVECSTDAACVPLREQSCGAVAECLTVLACALYDSQGQPCQPFCFALGDADAVAAAERMLQCMSDSSRSGWGLLALENCLLGECVFGTVP